MSLAVRAVRSTFFVATGHYSAMLINFAAMLVLARLLDPADFGVFSLSLFFVGLLDVTGKLGLGMALIHRREIDGAVLPTHFTIAVLSSLVSIGLGFLVSFLLPLFGYDKAVSSVMVVLAAVLVIQSAGLTSQLVLEKELRFARTMAVTVSSLLISQSVAILLAFNGAGVWSLVAGSAANSVLLTTGMWIVSPWRFWSGSFKFDWRICRWFLSFGAVVAISSFATIGVLQLDNFLIGSLIGLSALGFYDRAYRIAQLPTALVTHVASKSSMSLYAKVQDNRERLSRAFKVTLELIINLSLPLALIVFVAAPEIVSLLLGDKWSPSVPLLRALLGFSVLRPIHDDVGALLAATGRPKALSFLLSMEAVTMLFVAPPLTILLGAPGTALGVNIAFVVGMGVAFWLARKSIDLNLFGVIRTPIAAATSGMLVWFLFLRTIGDTGLPIFIVFGLKAGITFVAYTAVVVLIERNQIKQRFIYFKDLVRGAVNP